MHYFHLQSSPLVHFGCVKNTFKEYLIKFEFCIRKMKYSTKNVLHEIWYLKFMNSCSTEDGYISWVIMITSRMQLLLFWIKNTFPSEIWLLNFIFYTSYYNYNRNGVKGQSLLSMHILKYICMKNLEFIRLLLITFE